MNPKLAEFLAGCRDEAPLQLGVAPFAMLYGIGALTASALFVHGGEVAFMLDTPKPWAALVAALVAWHTRHVLTTIAAGMATLCLLKLLF